jgi:hypothetical protein
MPLVLFSANVGDVKNKRILSIENGPDPSRSQSFVAAYEVTAKSSNSSGNYYHVNM